MVLTKLQTAAAAVLVVGSLVVGTGMAAYQVVTAQQPDTQRGDRAKPDVTNAEPPRPPQPPQAHADPYDDPLPAGAMARLGTLRLRRDDQSAGNLAFSLDSKALVSARTARVIQFWDVAMGKPLQELRQEEQFDCFALSADGGVLTTAGCGWITVWDVVRKQQISKIAAGEVNAIAVAPGRKRWQEPMSTLAF